MSHAAAPKVHESLDAYNRKIPFFNYPALFKDHEEDYVRIFRDVCGRGAYILQKDLSEFEAAIAKFLKVKHVIGTADGTNAIMIGLMAIGLKPGDEVIVSSHTYIATASAAQMLGARAVPCDIGPDNLMDPASVERLITERTRVILPTHVNGRTCAMDPIMALAEKHGLMVAEDAAQALGSTYKGRAAGTFGRFGTFSFYPAKILGCFGDGGAVITNDDTLGAALRALRDHGRDETGKVVLWGTNSRLDNLQAAFLHYNFKSYPEIMARRRAIAAMYTQGLSDVAELRLPAGPDSQPDHYDVFQNYELAAENRDALREFLKDKGIGTIIQWAGTPVHQFKDLYPQTPSLPKVDHFFARCMMLPMNMTLSDDDVRHVIAAIRAFYGRA
ncbi:MAG: DegT/DnrJ/EryC1/StrS family aminotransferase [Rhodospirillales bacterium]|nr:DegT/DnrJ/EryC1/StrS family aminotransferase [Alphaproteobacteria bacterium]MCB9986257.1 DegT/DnrJ/EryC1/StrS family aminotransferase [Rhodospirillales bacterium]USO07188.1 MAG: DegT/DnrJ/EryC1/StrS family aminotransferase [Rhodospirillales bacterium]